MAELVDFEEYKLWIENIKVNFKTSQIKASRMINREMMNFYWNLGKDMIEMQSKYNWGSSFIKRISTDLKKEFSDICQKDY